LHFIPCVAAYLYLQDLSKDDAPSQSQSQPQPQPQLLENTEHQQQSNTLTNDDPEIMDDSNDMKSMQELHKTPTPTKLEIPQRDENEDPDQVLNAEEIEPEQSESPKDKQCVSRYGDDKDNKNEPVVSEEQQPEIDGVDVDQHEERKDDEKISMEPDNDMIKIKSNSITMCKRKRRASLDSHLLDYYCKSFNLSHFFIEIDRDKNVNDRELLKLEPFETRKGYSISCRYDIESQYRFTIRFVSRECVSLCARWLDIIDDCQILGHLSSLKHLKRIEYNNGQYVYIWKDHKLHDYGDCYLQLGRQYIISSDIQENNKYYKLRHSFVPLDLPLLHINFTANSPITIKDGGKSNNIDDNNNSRLHHKHYLME